MCTLYVGKLAKLAYNAAGSFVGQALGDTIDNKHIDYGAAGISTLIGTLGIEIPFDKFAASEIMTTVLSHNC